MRDARQTWSYQLAGLHVRSDFRLPEAIHDDAPAMPDSSVSATAMTIEDGRRLGLPPPPGGSARSADAQRVRYVAPGVGAFVIEDGRRIVAWPDDEAEPGTLSQQLTGPALALALMQQGALVLHASVVAIDHVAVLIAGHSGDGKSTLAAALARAGHDVLADDLAVVDVQGDVPAVRPVSALVRLADVETPPAAHADAWVAAGKTVQRLATQTDGRQPTCVAAIVVLGWGATFDVAPVGDVEAALLLLEYAFCRPAFAAPQAAAALAGCARLAGRCPVRVARRPRDLRCVGALVGTIEHIARAKG